MDWQAEGLLEGLEGEAREARVRLLDRLHRDGVELAELRRAAEDRMLPFLAAERVVRGEGTLSLRDVAERAGVELEVLCDLRRAQGLPVPDRDVADLPEEDVELAQTIRGLLDAGVPLERLRETARVIGRGLRPIAELMRGMALEQALDPDLPEDELAAQFEARAAALTPFVQPALVGAMRLHLRTMVASEVAVAAQRRGGLDGAEVIGVAFADLSGFTKLGERIEPDALGAVADRLSGELLEHAAPGVQVVKELGDGAMLVASEPTALVETALTLVEAFEDLQDMPPVRVGVACGPAIPRAGDWFGRPVNLASRITGVARPGTVLATGEVREAAGDERFHWSATRPRKLKGVSEALRLHRARRAQDGR